MQNKLLKIENSAPTYQLIKLKMNTLAYYVKAKDNWTPDEERYLHQSKVANKNIMEIADYLKRTPGSCAYKMKTLGLIADHTKVIGYEDYQKSALYAEIKASDPKPKKDRPSNNQELQDIKNMLTALQKDVAEIKGLIDINNKLSDIRNLIINK
jgi:hypothetical protein